MSEDLPSFLLSYILLELVVPAAMLQTSSLASDATICHDGAVLGGQACWSSGSIVLEITVPGLALAFWLTAPVHDFIEHANRRSSPR